MDPDKKVEEARRKRPEVFNSNSHPEHFENEGGEFFERNEDLQEGFGLKDLKGLKSEECNCHCDVDSKSEDKEIKHGNGLSTGEGEEGGDFIGSGDMRIRDTSRPKTGRRSVLRK